jgi:hypothetical protein
MGKHYSGKELIARRAQEKQKQQAQQNGVRQNIRNINSLKRCVEEARQEMRQRMREEKRQ